MESTGPIGPKPILPKIKPEIDLKPTPPEVKPAPGKPGTGAIDKDHLTIGHPERTCKCSTGGDVFLPAKTVGVCIQLPTKTASIRDCGIGGPDKTAPGMCCFIPGGPELPGKTLLGCGINPGPFPTMKCPIDLPDLPIKTLKGCGIELPMTMKCEIGPLKTLGCGIESPFKTMRICSTEPPIKTAKICSVVPPHPPIRTCWCLPTQNPFPEGPTKTVILPDGPLKTIFDPAPTPKCFVPPTHK